MDHWLLCACFPPWSLALLRVVSEVTALRQGGLARVPC